MLLVGKVLRVFTLSGKHNDISEQGSVRDIGENYYYCCYHYGLTLQNEQMYFLLNDYEMLIPLKWFLSSRKVKGNVK